MKKTLKRIKQACLKNTIIRRYVMIPLNIVSTTILVAVLIVPCIVLDGVIDVWHDLKNIWRCNYVNTTKELWHG